VIALIALTLGCSQPEQEITLRGQVLTGRETTTGAEDVSVTVRDSQTELYSSSTTDAQGKFAIKAPASSVVHLVFDGGAYVPTAFSTIVGAADIELPVGTLWMRSPVDIDTLRTTFSSCPTAQTPGGVMEGEVNYKLSNQRTDERLIAEEASVTIYDRDGITYTVCYLDDDGESSTEVEQVGATGRFAAFGLNPGPTTVGFEVQVDSLTIENFAFVWLPEDGVGPIYPALIDLP